MTKVWIAHYTLFGTVDVFKEKEHALEYLKKEKGAWDLMDIAKDGAITLIYNKGYSIRVYEKPVYTYVPEIDALTYV